MNKEATFLRSIYDSYGNNAQEALDFITNENNLNSAKRLVDTEAVEATPVIGIYDKMPDGVYFISDEEYDITKTRNYSKFVPGMTAAPFPTKYIGVKLGSRSIAVALADLPGDDDGELQLLPDTDCCPKDSDQYSWNEESKECRFNIFEDFDGKGNTKHLKDCGCTIELPDGEWIPSMGELGLLMMHAKKVNRAIELAGGKPIKGWYWSSTEYSQGHAWVVGLGNGGVTSLIKYGSCALRAVAAF